MERPTERIRAGVAVLTSTRSLRAVEVELRDGLIVGYDSVPEASLTPQERATILTPGLVNAHAHFDLGALRGSVSASRGFLAWVQELVSAREGLAQERLEAGVRASAWEALRTGTTSVLDVDSMGLTEGALRRAGPRAPRAILLREVLDGSPQGRTARTVSACQLAEAAVARGHGLSPHGAHTVGDALLSDLALIVTSAPSGPGSVPVGVHWAETPEEGRWLMEGEGPFASWLGPSPELSGTERLARAGLLTGTLLIHGNHPEPGELERLAAAGCTVVHCPGCHHFFGRERFPVESYLAAGVRLALGTDSWASNDRLDLRREMRLARDTLGLSAASAWRMATETGAEAIPDNTVTGTIIPGSAADLVEFLQPSSVDTRDLGALEASALETLTQSEPQVRSVWVGGRRTSVA